MTTLNLYSTRAIATVPLLVGVFVLVAWAAGHPELTALRSELWVTVKRPTGMLCAQVGIAALALTLRNSRIEHRGHGVALFACLWAISGVLNALWVWRTGSPLFDDYYMVDRSPIDTDVMTTVHGSPSLGTLFSFSLATFFIISSAWKEREFRWIGRALIFIGAMALMGYAFDVPFLYWYWKGLSTAMAALTAISVLCLGIVIEAGTLRKV